MYVGRTPGILYLKHLFTYGTRRVLFVSRVFFSRSATVDMIPAVMTDVVRLLKHDRELVRKKAVMVLHRLNQLDPDVSK